LRIGTLLILGACLCAALPAASSERLPADWEKVLREQLQCKISFDFADNEPAEAIGFLMSFSTLKAIVVDSDAFKDANRLKMAAQDVPAYQTLTQVLDRAGLEFQPGDFALYVVKKGAPAQERIKPLKPVSAWEQEFYKAVQRKVTFEWRDKTLYEAAAYLGELCKVNILLDPRLTAPDAPTTSMQVKAVTGEEALMGFIGSQDLNYQLRDEALFIHPKGLYMEAAAAAAALTPTERETLRTALAELGAEDFDVRQRASKTLSGLGARVVFALRQALPQAAGPEVRMRLKELLGKFPMVDFFGEAPDAAKALDALDRCVSFELANNSLEETLSFLTELARLQANTTIKLAATADAKPLRETLRVQSMKLGHALRWVARLAGARIALQDGVLVFEKRQ